MDLSETLSLSENARTTGEVIHRHNSFEYVSTKTSNFPWLQNFSAFWRSFDSFQVDEFQIINIVFVVGKYHS